MSDEFYQGVLTTLLCLILTIIIFSVGCVVGNKMRIFEYNQQIKEAK